MKKFLPLLFLVFSIPACAQHTEVTIEDTQTISGAKTFSAVPSLNNIIFVDGVTYPKTGAGIIAAALAACGGPSGTKNGRVIIPAGTYSFSSPGWNLTNMTGCMFEGDSTYASAPGDSGKTGTVLQFNYTGAGTVGVDISGSIYLDFKDITFSCGTSAANAPTVCFLQGRTSGSNGIMNKLEDSIVAGYSPYIYYNYHGEQFSSIDSQYIEYGTTGIPITLSYANTAGITSPNVTFGGANSETIEIFFGTKTMASSQSTTSTYPNNCLIYLDEGSGLIQGSQFIGYMNELNATNGHLVCDTTGASGTLDDFTFNLQVDSGSTTNNQLFVIAGTPRMLNVRGKVNPVGATGGPALSFTNASSLVQSDISIITGITNVLSGTSCPGSIIHSDITGTIACPGALIIGGDSQGAGRVMFTNWPIASGGNAPTLSGTGACASRTTQLGGGSLSGQITCTGTTGASTLTITANGFNAPSGLSCHGSDTTAAHLLIGSQSGVAVGTCTLNFTSVTANDVITWAIDSAY